ncbi:MAG TPA: hypothetical protein VD905_16925 [Flavobacteriales bacterium]|nr:hypothetical protein [Flavobacteriales bacterium]
MKIFLLLLIVPVTTCFAGVKESDIPYYQVTAEKKDLSLDKNTAKIIFHFEEHSGACLRGTVTYTVNGKNAPQPTLDSMGFYSRSIKPGKHKFVFSATNCNPIQTKAIEIKNQCVVSMLVHFHSNVIIYEADKPVIYLYPEKETEVSVKLDFKGEMDFSYPLYNNGWNVVAHPNGTIKSGAKEYGYLFYEGKIDSREIKTRYLEGSVVNSSELTCFLETSLTAIGLNTKEIADFVTYWAPRMLQNEKNYVRFMLTDEYDQVAKLEVMPKPDHVLRVYMLWQKADNNTPGNLKKQTFIPFKRGGFTVVEWGGSEVKDVFIPAIAPK